MKIKYKHIITIAVIAIITNILGALFKILHWEIPVAGMSIKGSVILGLGLLLWIIAAILLVVKIVIIIRKPTT